MLPPIHALNITRSQKLKIKIVDKSENFLMTFFPAKYLRSLVHANLKKMSKKHQNKKWIFFSQDLQPVLQFKQKQNRSLLALMIKLKKNFPSCG